MAHSEPVPDSAVDNFAQIDARLVNAIEVEQDRFRRSQYVLARELLVEAKIMPPDAQRKILAYLEALATMAEKSRISEGDWSTNGEETDVRVESVEKIQSSHHTETVDVEER